MKKPKVTVSSLKKLYEGLQKDYQAFRFAAKNYIYTLQNPSVRSIATIEAADALGKLNGLTVVELIAIVNTVAGTDERVYLTAYNKAITVWAEKRHPSKPPELA
jgi:hypothetical protein